MKNKVFISFLIAMLTGLAIIFFPVKWLEPLVKEKVMEQSAFSQNADTFQGRYLQSKMMKNSQYIPIYGSSELSGLNEFHPSNFFYVNHKGFTPYIVGRGGTQTLIHLLSLSQFDTELKGKKMIIILSPQWFAPDGLSQDYAKSNFSVLQAYNLVFNDNLSPEYKRKVINRLLEFNVVQENTIVKLVFKAEASDSIIDRVIGAIVKPAAYMHQKILEKRDLLLAINQKDQPFTAIHPEQIQQKSAAELLQYANDLGKQSITNNEFNIRDDYYDYYIKNKLPELKGSYQNSSYSESKEYDDLKLLLQFLKEKQADPLFISVPVNGYWYDYGGFPKDRRIEYYKKVNKLIASEDFKEADFSKYEYEKYFLKDTMHLGWKGWYYINQEIEKFSSK